MTDFLLFLGKLNLAMGAAIIFVYLLRRPLRDLFGAPIAYAVWLLVPIASLASLLPPRVASPSPAYLTPVQYPAAMSLMRQIVHPALRITERLTTQSALVHPMIAAKATTAPAYGTPDYAMLLLVAWVLGAVLMALYLARLQVRFYTAVRLGEAGPAVLGFFRPRIVVPDAFREQFTAPEQEAILAHERVHLARQDAHINALAALLRCLCWFNPLVHLGAAWLRIDQELACDATTVAGSVSRRDYAKALLKSQMAVTALPLGCNWPGSQHPLIQRISLLKRKPPGTARRLAGVGLVMFAATIAGLGAWAAQPPVAAKSMGALQAGMALATLPVMVAPGQTAGHTGPGQPVATANPTGSGNDVDASKNARASRAVSAAPVAHMQAKATPNPLMTTNAQRSAEQALPPTTETSTAALPTNQVAINQAERQAFQTNEAATTSADPATRLPAAPPQLLPKEVSASETVASSNDPPATPVQPPPNASPAAVVALNDQPVSPMQTTTRNLSVGPVQAALSTPPATPAKTDSSEPYVKTTCNSVPGGAVTGRVTSSKTIQIPKFACQKFDGGAGITFNMGPFGRDFATLGRYPGPCEHPTPTLIWGRVCPNIPWLTLYVQLANPADASKMPLGKLVKLNGDFFVITKNKDYRLFVQNAKVLHADPDPFGR